MSAGRYVFASLPEASGRRRWEAEAQRNLELETTAREVEMTRANKAQGDSELSFDQTLAKLPAKHTVPSAHKNAAAA